MEADTEPGTQSLMIAGDLGTVNELNVRARADRIAAGPGRRGRHRACWGAAAGVGDSGGDPTEQPTPHHRKTLGCATGTSWIVTATHEDGSMTVQRVGGHGVLVLPADYVGAQVELAYASTAHRAQGRTVDTAHAMVAPTTTREVLYVSATRGRERATAST